MKYTPINELENIQFYITVPGSCPYIPERESRSLIASEDIVGAGAYYSELIQLGFRRSGLYIYRPQCSNCQACLSMRVLTQDFCISRSQKRALKQHQHLEARIQDISFSEEEYQLYLNYQLARHDGILEDNSRQHYYDFLINTSVNTLKVCFYDNEQLKMVSILDRVKDGLSAVYTFYDTRDKTASYGTYCILWLIQWCQRQKLPYLYLGYWIKESQKMAYKEKFSPKEILVQGKWQLSP
jgi:leucyl-tRNA---protein transferase